MFGIAVLIGCALAFGCCAVFLVNYYRSEQPEDTFLPKSLTSSPTVDPPPTNDDVVDSSNAVVLSSLLPHQFIVLDLETTGLNPLTDEIIEFGAILVSLDTETHPSFQCLVRPLKKVPRRITEITGITQEMVDKDGRDAFDAFARFVEFIGDLPIVTYNADFDMGFLYSAAKKHGIKLTNRYTCALKRARRAWPDLPSHRLAYIAEVAGIPCDDSHRALGDCKRALTIFMYATSTLNCKVRWSKPSFDAN
jgi:DNA polymerase III epsilon subunit family exonuclease